MATLTLDAICKRYGAATVIEGLDLTMASGEFVTLLGPSGCGKTTTLKIIAGLERPDAGSVRLGETDVTALAVSKRGIGVVFQSLALFPHMTVAQNVAFGLRMRRIATTEVRRRVATALDLVQLTSFAHKVPAELSGGQQQRVALARAFVIEPPILLLDEPLSALDRKLRESMQVEIRALTRRLGVTAVFVTHDQSEALVLSDRIAVMNHGRIEQIDTPPSLFRHPRTAFVAGFMGVSNMLAGRYGVDGTTLVVDALPGLILHALIPGPPGHPIEIGLRPEDAVLQQADSSPDGSMLLVKVEQAIYQGTTMALTLRPMLAPTLSLAVVVPVMNTLPATGTVTRVSWRAEDVLVFSV